MSWIKKMARKPEFSKKLLYVDYAVLFVLLAAFLIAFFREYDTTQIVVALCAWIAQLAISTGCYYHKAKCENLVKLPIFLLSGLPPEMKEKADPNQIIASVLGIGISQN